MKICLLGSTGRVGSIILKNLINHGLAVNVLVRDKNRLSTNSSLVTNVEGNVFNQSDLRNVIEGTDIVISALNTDGTNTLSVSTPMIIEEMKVGNCKRIITIGTAGILQARSEPHLYRFQSKESKRKTTKDAEEHLKAYLCLKESGLEWTVVCPTYLPVGERIGKYRYEKEFLPDHPSSISVYDTADFACKQIWDKQFIRYRVGLTY